MSSPIGLFTDESVGSKEAAATTLSATPSVVSAAPQVLGEFNACWAVLPACLRQRVEPLLAAR